MKLEKQIYQVLLDQVESSNSKANIKDLKEQMRTIKKLMSANRGRDGNSTLKNDVLKYQQNLT
jgi:hypothetical protein